MLKQLVIIFTFIIFAALTACEAPATPAPQPTAAPTFTIAEVAPTLTAIARLSATSFVTCSDIDTYWGNDWSVLLDVLEKLIETEQNCGPEPLLSKKYAAHFNYGTSLEEQGQIENATAHFRAALSIDPHRREALGALVRLKALPRPTPPACTSTSPARPDPAPAERPDTARFVKIAKGQIQLAGKPFAIKGLNYYPRNAPWERFWTEADPAAMAEELDLIRDAGFNTLRLFLWYEPLFTCQPEDAIPNETAFTLLDTLFRLADERDLKLIISLNDLPDLVYRPLYTDYTRYDAQTTYIVRRYRNEQALLAWDVRNAPDFDLENSADSFTEQDVINWLNHITVLIRKHDPHHLITAGWDKDPRSSEPYVDILAFQHWDTPDVLAERLADYRSDSTKPLLMIAAGEHSWPLDPNNPQNEASQANYLKQLTNLTKANKVGWVIWTAFDFVPAPGQPDNYNFHFGLWQTDLSPKSALKALPLN